MTAKYGGFDDRKLPAEDVRTFRETFVARLRAWRDKREQEKRERELREQERV